MPGKRKKDEHLWLVKAYGLDSAYWILAGANISSAVKKAEKLFAQMARRRGVSPFRILSVKARGTIDIF
jgi:hypothetical protein